VTRRRWLLPVLVVVIVGAGAAAGYGLRELTTQTSDGQEETSAAPTTTTTAAGGEPDSGPRAVELAPDVAADPGGVDIRNLLQRHFDAINNGDYGAWQATVTRARAAGFPKQLWREQYGSTRDGTILVHRIEPTQAGTIVLISFTSTQDPTLAPDKVSGCLRWQVGYLVVIERGELRLGPSEPAASQHTPC
jgi:hypothetical protein